MDERLRELGRKFYQEGSIELGLRYYSLLFHHGGLGQTLAEAITDLVGQQHDRLPAQIVSGEFVDMVYGILRPEYSITLTVLTRNPVRCRCGATGPHNHLLGETIIPLPSRLLPYRLDEPLREYIQPSTMLQYQQPYSYTLSFWQFTTQPPDENQPEAFWTDGNWYLRRVWMHNLNVNDTRTPTNEAGFYVNRIPFSWFRWSPNNRYHYPHLSYRELFDNRDAIQITRSHELPPQPPHLVTGPCEDFRILPKGGTIFIPGYGHLPTGGTVTVMNGPVMQTEVVIDTSTACGHGFVEMPDGSIFPLCPPTWSDTRETAGIYCEMCLKIQPEQPTGRMIGKFNICNECRNRISNQNRLEEIMEYREEDKDMTSFYCETCSEQRSEDEVTEEDTCVYCDEPIEQYFGCPFCRQSQESPQEAMEHCTKISPIDYRELIPR